MLDLRSYTLISANHRFAQRRVSYFASAEVYFSQSMLTAVYYNSLILRYLLDVEKPYEPYEARLNMTGPVSDGDDFAW